MSTDETYGGYANRETYMVAVYLDNEREWYESARGILTGVTDAAEAGRALEYLVTERLDALDDPAHRTRELVMIARDIGSLWRVSWAELGRTWLDHLAEG